MLPNPQTTNFVNVVVQIDAPGLKQPLTYHVNELTVNIGDCVLVPFRNAQAIGHVVSVNAECQEELVGKTRPIAAVIDEASAFDADLLRVAQFVERHTLSDIRDAVKLIAPEVMTSKIRTTFQLADEWETRLAESTRSPSQRAVAETLNTLGGKATSVQLARLSKQPNTAALIKELKRKGVVSETRSITRAQAREKKIRLLRLDIEASQAKTLIDQLSAKGAVRQALLLAALVDAANSTDIIPIAGVSVASQDQSAARALADKGLAVYVESGVRRNPYRDEGFGTATSPPLNAAQRRAVDRINLEIDKRSGATVLLHGVTGSGKTEVYLNTVAATLANGFGAIVVVPEIGLTAQLLALFKTRLGEENVAVLHSGLGVGERHDEWQRIKNREARVVLGPRSAIYAPVWNLSLIIMDEEHDGSYKQDSSPRYHARDVAQFRGSERGAVVVLGSATPSLESRFKAENGDYLLLELNERIDNRPLPQVTIVDLRQEFARTKIDQQDLLPASGSISPEHPGIFGTELRTAMAETLSRSEQAILFLNRRGFASFLLCRDCGHTFRCPNCDVSLTYHNGVRLLRCHHCDHAETAVEICPQCNGPRLRPFGLGTEKVEQAVQAMFPEARTIRMDRDTMSKKGAHEQALAEFRRGEADVLIGTQIVAKGLDFPQVTLVGVVTADTMLNIPDFRTAERSFQLLTQVAGRAGRGKKLGKVLIQTFSPEHPSVDLASTHDYSSFYQAELQHRRELRYPPYSHLANIVASDEDEKLAVHRIGRIADILNSLKNKAPCEISLLGPVSSPIARVRNRWRWHITLKCSDRNVLRALLRAAMDRLDSSELSGVSVDIDPMTML